MVDDLKKGYYLLFIDGGKRTVSEAVADAFEKQKALPKEGSLVV